MSLDAVRDLINTHIGQSNSVHVIGSENGRYVKGDLAVITTSSDEIWMLGNFEDFCKKEELVLLVKCIQRVNQTINFLSQNTSLVTVIEREKVRDSVTVRNVSTWVNLASEHFHKHPNDNIDVEQLKAASLPSDQILCHLLTINSKFHYPVAAGVIEMYMHQTVNPFNYAPVFPAVNSSWHYLQDAIKNFINQQNILFTTEKNVIIGLKNLYSFEKDRFYETLFQDTGVIENYIIVQKDTLIRKNRSEEEDCVSLIIHLLSLLLASNKRKSLEKLANVFIDKAGVGLPPEYCKKVLSSKWFLPTILSNNLQEEKFIDGFRNFLLIINGGNFRHMLNFMHPCDFFSEGNMAGGVPELLNCAEENKDTCCISPQCSFMLDNENIAVSIRSNGVIKFAKSRDIQLEKHIWNSPEPSTRYNLKIKNLTEFPICVNNKINCNFLEAFSPRCLQTVPELMIWITLQLRKESILPKCKEYLSVSENLVKYADTIKDKILDLDHDDYLYDLNSITALINNETHLFNDETEHNSRETKRKKTTRETTGKQAKVKGTAKKKESSVPQNTLIELGSDSNGEFQKMVNTPVTIQFFPQKENPFKWEPKKLDSEPSSSITDLLNNMMEALNTFAMTIKSDEEIALKSVFDFMKCLHKTDIAEIWKCNQKFFEKIGDAFQRLRSFQNCLATWILTLHHLFDRKPDSIETYCTLLECARISQFDAKIPEIDSTILENQGALYALLKVLPKTYMAPNEFSNFMLAENDYDSLPASKFISENIFCILKHNEDGPKKILFHSWPSLDKVKEDIFRGLQQYSGFLKANQGDKAANALENVLLAMYNDLVIRTKGNDAILVETWRAVYRTVLYAATMDTTTVPDDVVQICVKCVFQLLYIFGDSSPDSIFIWNITKDPAKKIGHNLAMRFLKNIEPVSTLYAEIDTIASGYHCKKFPIGYFVVKKKENSIVPILFFTNSKEAQHVTSRQVTATHHLMSLLMSLYFAVAFGKTKFRFHLRYTINEKEKCSAPDLFVMFYDDLIDSKKKYDITQTYEQLNEVLGGSNVSFSNESKELNILSTVRHMYKDNSNLNENTILQVFNNLKKNSTKILNEESHILALHTFIQSSLLLWMSHKPSGLWFCKESEPLSERMIQQHKNKIKHVNLNNRKLTILNCEHFDQYIQTLSSCHEQ